MGKTLADLQSNISISAQNAVTGDIEFCTGYTGFSSDIGEQAGWYIALKIDTSTTEGALEGATITATYHNRTVTLDSDRIIIVRLAEGEDSITFTANKEGYTEGRLTLDLSGLDKEALTQNILYTASLTNGVTVSPLQFGESKTITGQVPWNTTDNANTFNISMRPFEMVAPGTPWSIAFNGVELAEGEFSLVTPESGSPYSFAGAKLPITQEMISAQSPYLVVTVRPDSADPVDAFYSSMNIAELTLAPDPRPKMNITSHGTNLVITPSTYSETKTATGTIPNYDINNTTGCLALSLSYSNIPTYSRYALIGRDENQNIIYSMGNLTNLPASIAISIASNKIGNTGNKCILTLRDGNDTTTLATAEIDVSQLSIAHNQFNVTSSTTGITVSPNTYNASKTMTGQVPYDTTSSSNKLTLTLDLLNEVAYAAYYFVQVRSGNSSGAVLAGGNNTFPASVEITLDSTNVTNGLYVMVGLRGSATGAVTPVEAITIDTSALTLEPAPTPPTPSQPNFIGATTGSFSETMFEMSPNYSTYYEFDPNNAFEASALTYTGSTTYQGHTIYQYEATPDFSNACYVKYFDSSLSWFSCRNIDTSGAYWLFTRSSAIGGATATSGVYDYGNQLSNVMDTNGFPCNAFYCIWNATNLGDYHYTKSLSGGGAPIYNNMSNADVLVFATKGDSTSIPSTAIEFKLYNSTGTDYILISIDMSNITASQYI